MSSRKLRKSRYITPTLLIFPYGFFFTECKNVGHARLCLLQLNPNIQDYIFWFKTKTLSLFLIPQMLPSLLNVFSICYFCFIHFFWWSIVPWNVLSPFLDHNSHLLALYILLANYYVWLLIPIFFLRCCSLSRFVFPLSLITLLNISSLYFKCTSHYNFFPLIVMSTCSVSWLSSEFE